ncbi:MAG: metallophosphoesterase family protein [Candidatus Ranarchaeia archaeon]|jgi:DNA repair exonuclease SbcCD nuclease subunit
MKALKFIHAADAHLNYYQYNLPERLQDFNTAFSWFGENVQEIKPDFVIMAGDLFDNPHPSNVVASHAIKTIDQMGCPFLVSPGSHDAPYNVTIGSILDPLDTGEHIQYLPRNPYETDDVYVLGLNNYRTRSIFERRFSEESKEYSIAPKKGKFNILSLHQGVNFPKLNLHPAMVEMYPNELPAGFDYYASGHIHRPFVATLPNDALYVQPGPFEPTDYTQANEDMGFYLVEVSAKKKMKLTRINNEKTREFRIIEEDFTKEAPFTITERATKLVEEQDQEGVVIILVLKGMLPFGTSKSDINYLQIREAASSALYVQIVNKLKQPDIILPDTPHEPSILQARRFFKKYFDSAFGNKAERASKFAEDVLQVYEHVESRKKRDEEVLRIIDQLSEELINVHKKA